MEVTDETILQKLREWVVLLEKTGDADKPIAASGFPVEYITPRSVLKDVEEGNEEGRRFLESWKELALRHILDSPIF